LSKCKIFYNLTHLSLLIQKIKNWFGNHKSVPLEDESTLVRVWTLWNYGLVVQNVHKEDINKILSQSSLSSQDAGWLQTYQLAVNEVIQSLGGEKAVVEEYGPMAKLWNNTAPPDHVERR
jgi:hypothetical protein